MSQLHSLFQTLSEQEKEIICSQRLIGKEKEVFDYILKKSNEELENTQLLLKELSITDSHFYKIHSVLVRKCYEWLVPNQGMELLQFLKRKNLFNLLRHEILFQEKKLNAHADKTEFYLKCFHFLIDFPYKFYDSKLTDSFGEKYLKSLPNQGDSEKLYVQFHKLFSEINRNAARKDPLKTLKVAIDDLLKEEKKLETTQHHLAKYYLLRSICSYYTYYEKNDEKVIEYLQKAMQLKKAIAYFFSIDIGKFLDLLYADALFASNKTDEAHDKYNQIFATGVDEDMYGYYYHCEQYCLTLIIKKEYDKAHSLLNAVFKPCIDNKMDIYATRGAMTFAKLFLSSGELKSALRFLNIAKGINEKSFYLPFDIQLRVLESIYFILKKDFEFVSQLANKNIKFLKSQQQHKLFADYLLLWKTISVAIAGQSKKSKEKLPVKENFDFLNKRYRNLYCDLIKTVSDNLQ